VAILPIDLQTLYTQLDKVAKTQVHQQVAAQAAQEAQMVANKVKSEHKLKSVQETDAGSEKTGVVHEREGAGAQQGGTPSGERKEGEEGNPGNAEPTKEIIKDPALGNNIDISG